MKNVIFTVLILLASVVQSSAQNKVIVKDGAQAMKYNKMIFGQFVEHFHTQIKSELYFLHSII
ncbi:MAG: hypothetical protein IJN30_01620 [Bacteroidales bacterium]|nr:hypothetical protein [Bacteroidales bacterium]